MPSRFGVFVLWMLLLTSCRGEPSAKVADSIVGMNGSDHAWIVVIYRALGVQFGISDEHLHQVLPGAVWEKLPEPLEALIAQCPASLPDLVPALSDSRNTGLLTARRPYDKGGQVLRCSELAQAFVSQVVPMQWSGDAEPPPDAYAKAVREWTKACAGLSTEARLKLWFERAPVELQRLRLPFFLAADHAPAWPLIEASFLKRSVKDPDDYLTLEIAAYLRHRRTGAADFWRSLKSQAEPKWLAKAGRYLGVENGSPLLVQEDRLDVSIDQWLSGKGSLSRIERLAVGGIDQPWAYHSMPVEPAFMHAPVAERDLLALLKGATKTDNAEQRKDILTLANEESSILLGIIRHAGAGELPPRPRPDHPAMASLAGALEKLLEDGRPVATDGGVTSSAQLAACITWDLWGTSTNEMDTIFGGTKPDWRGLSDLPMDGELLVAAAREILKGKLSPQPEEFPAAAAKELADGFQEGSAEEWRTRIKRLSWDQRLMLSEQATKDGEFAKRLWPRMLHWAEWRGAADAPAGFPELWERVCAGKQISPEACDALTDWLATEARAGRFWTISAESRPTAPGFSLAIARTRPLRHPRREEPEDPKAPGARLHVLLRGTDRTVNQEFTLQKGALVEAKQDADADELHDVLENIADQIPSDSEKKPFVHSVELRLIFRPEGRAPR